MNFKVDIEQPDWEEVQSYAPDVRDHWLFSKIVKDMPKLARRLNIKEDTPLLGACGSARAAATSKYRVVKSPRSSFEGKTDAWAAHLLSKHGKIPYLVQSFGVIYLPDYDHFLLRLERLHTTLTKYAKRKGYDKRVYSYHDQHHMFTEPFDKKAWIKELRTRMKRAGLSDAYIDDLHTGNIMFDRRNRPTFFDFSHFGPSPTRKQLKQIPYWDEQKGVLVHRDNDERKAA